MMAEIDDKNSAAAQKLSWEALRKSLNGLINKVSVSGCARCGGLWRVVHTTAHMPCGATPAGTLRILSPP